MARHVPHHLLGLLRDGLARELTRLEHDPELAGDEDEIADPDRLVVGRALERARGAVGADDVLVRHCRLLLSSGVVEGRTERLEDRLEDVLRVLALEEPHVDRQAGLLCEPAQERGGKVGAEASRLRRGEIRIRRDQRLSRRLRARPSRAPRPPRRSRLPSARGADVSRPRAPRPPRPPLPRARPARSRASGRSARPRRARAADDPERPPLWRCGSRPRARA